MVHFVPHLLVIATYVSSISIVRAMCRLSTGHRTFHCQDDAHTRSAPHSVAPVTDVQLDPAPLEPSQQEGTNLNDLFREHGGDLDLLSSLIEAKEDIRCENFADSLVQKVTPTVGDLAVVDDAIVL
jgi:hypothetical protein